MKTKSSSWEDQIRGDFLVSLSSWNPVDTEVTKSDDYTIYESFINEQSTNRNR